MLPNPQPELKSLVSKFKKLENLPRLETPLKLRNSSELKSVAGEHTNVCLATLIYFEKPSFSKFKRGMS